MRFLLNATTAAAASKPLGASAAMQVTKGTAGTSAAAAGAAASAAVTTSRAVAAAGGGVSIPRHLQQPPRLQKSWGQQCSPNCGCVVRYETVVDEATDRIVDVTYHAKSVLLSASGPPDDGSLVPQLTQTPDTNSTDSTKGRPILTECRCPTVHQLSSRITGYLRDRSLQHIYNTVEFSGVRSSPSFRRAVLAENGLGRGSTGCYDLVEEAFVACIKGYMPKPRRAHDAGYNSSPFPSAMPQHYVDDCEFDNDNDDDYSTYESDEEERRMLVDKAAEDNNADDATTVADHPSRGLALNPTRYADAARRAGKAFPPSHHGNGTMNVYKANDPVSNMPSYSFLAGDQSENKESECMYNPRPTVGIGSGGGGDGMPAFHISEEELNELEKRYDYELDDLREVQGYLVAANGSAGRRKVAAIDDEERALLLSDWQAYVDGEMNKNDTNKEEAS